jgi:hypothetical protein
MVSEIFRNGAVLVMTPGMDGSLRNARAAISLLHCTITRTRREADLADPFRPAGASMRL